jgi:hypothetical protein
MGSAVDALWTIVRDICNVAFIFAFIYIGIKTILDGVDGSGMKRLLAQLIIAALLINFSLFFVKVVIDVSNVLALEIHNTLIDTSSGSISWEFAKSSGMQTFWGGVDQQTLADKTKGGSITFFVMTFALLCVAGFVLGAGGILLAVRFVALIFIMIFSPILFAAQLFPQTAGYSKSLLSNLLKYSFFAPAFLFLLYCSIRVLQTVSSTALASTAGFSQDFFAENGVSQDAWTVFLQFFIAIAFLFGSLKLAQSLSIKGADGVMKFGKQIRGSMQGFAKRRVGDISSWAGRNTLGKAAESAEKRYNQLAAVASNEGLSRWERTRARAKMKGIALSTGAITERATLKSLQSTQKNKFGGQYSREDDAKFTEERQRKTTSVRGEMQREEAIKAYDTSDPTKMDEMVKAVKSLTTDQMKEMDLKILTNEDVALHLSSKQIDDLQKTGKYSDQQIEDIKTARKNGIKKIVDPTNAAGTVAVGTQNQRELLAQRGVDEIAKMPIEVLKSPEMRKYLTPAIVEAKMKDGISGTDLAEVEANIQHLMRDPSIPANLKAQWTNWQGRSTYGARFNL